VIDLAIACGGVACLTYGNYDFQSQADIDNFQAAFPYCTELQGKVTINGNDIMDLSGLGVVTSIGGDLGIGGNSALTSLTGMENLTSIGGELRIGNNSALTSLTGMENLISIGGDFLFFNNNSLTSLIGLGNLISIGDNLSINSNNALNSLTGIESLTSIGGDLYIYDNIALNSLAGLENLTSIGDNLWISNNHSLPSLMGFNNLNEIGGGLYIPYNNSLTSLSGLENLTSIGGGLSIGSNYVGNPALTSLSGLENLASIGGGLDFRSNGALTSLMGLERIAPGSINYLYLTNNSSLSTCEVQSVCDYLLTPDRTVYINDNATGCNSQEEVIASCETLGLEEPAIIAGCIISPNPFSYSTNISFELPWAADVSIHIFNTMGVKVAQVQTGLLSAGQQHFTWFAGHLPGGLYLCRVQAGNEVVAKKIIKH